MNIPRNNIELLLVKENKNQVNIMINEIELLLLNGRGGRQVNIPRNKIEFPLLMGKIKST